MDINIIVLLLMLLLLFAIGVFLVLKTPNLAWKIVGWFLVASNGLLLLLLIWASSRAFRN
jgi:multisubunit Na+/H+ antiporter MnhC subunit